VIQAAEHIGGLGQVVADLPVDDLYVLDTALPSVRIAIEANGPWHFAANTTHVMGRSLLKTRLLSAMGWHIVRADVAEWRQLHPGSRVSFIEQQLRTILGRSNNKSQ
jgi:hypothetical protein